jgi:Caspase domain/Domain of unknown function (DUF4384)
MIQIKRRQFLQGAGAALATLGFSQLELHHHALRYAKVLAQGTPRKRALLIGISDYLPIREGSGWAALPGAVNDVEMQRELLVHRFGFNQADVRLITNQKAKRQSILEEFEDLIQWSRPGDVVVVHYSGHGSTVDDPDRVFKDNLNGTIVPWDSDLPPGGGEVNDITAGTLFLLMKALKTENVTIVLDSCYSGGGARGNLVIRSRPGQAELLLRGETGAKLVASEDERAYQQQWLGKLNLSRADWVQQRRDGLAKGAALLAAQRNQEAADVTFAGDTHAGVFTYALTRYLWQQTRNEAMGPLLVATKAKTERLLSTLDGKKHSQTPEFQEKPNSGNQQQPTYFLADFAAKQAAEAVVTQVKGNQVQMLLNGVEPQVLETLGKGASLNLIDTQGVTIGTVEITGRNQLSAQGTVKLKKLGTIAPGALLQERSRVIPTDWTLRIGLDASLGSEMAIAKAELPKIQTRIEAVPLLKQEVHYILGRMTQPIFDALSQRKVANVPAVGSLGLFYSGLELLPESFGQPGESVQVALEQRLKPKFNFLLAARLLKLALNTTSSRLQVNASVRVANARDLTAQAVAVRGSQAVTQIPISPSQKQIRAGQSIQIVVQNQEPQDLYFAVVLFSINGEVEPLPFGPAKIAAGQTIFLPDTSRNEFPITLNPPLGTVEVMVVFSTTSLERAIVQLKNLSAQVGENRGEQAVLTIDTLLDDLAGMRGSSQSQERRLDVRQMAALSVTFEIISNV